jgi:hypothetical protein
MTSPLPTISRFTTPLAVLHPSTDVQGSTVIGTAYARATSLHRALDDAFDLAFQEIARYQDTFVKRMDRSIGESHEQLVEVGHDNIVDNVRLSEVRLSYIFERNLLFFTARVVLSRDY